MKVIIVFVVSCLIFTLASGLKDSDVQENKLHEIIFKLDNKPIDLDLNWMSSVDTWYVPTWSKLHSYRVAADILRKDTISEEDLYTSCLMFHKDGSIDAFGKIVDFQVKSDPQYIEFSLPWKKMISRFSFKLTDNKSFIFGVASWMDGQLSWVVISAKPSLDVQSKQRISDFIKALGMDKNLAVTNNYENCKKVTHTDRKEL